MGQGYSSRRRFLKRSLLAGAGLAACPAAWGDGPPTLRDLADGRGLRIGPAVAHSPLVTDPTYRQTLRREFNILTPENAMKWAATHPRRHHYTFAQADRIVRFALAHGIAVHGHNLVWEDYNPDWLTSGDFSRNRMISILEDHISTVAGRYRGSVAAWDVVNEAVDGDGNLRGGVWRDRLGPDYLDLAFQFASAADPTAVLLYNDLGAEEVNAKSTGIYNMIKGMLGRGIPVHGVGFEMHIDNGGINYQGFAQNLRRFADLGLALFVTEMDVRLPLPATPDLLALQASIYGNVLAVVLGQPACQGFQTWGFTDKYSWIPKYFPGFGAALVLDEDYNPKPAYGALRAGLVP